MSYFDGDSAGEWKSVNSTLDPTSQEMMLLRVNHGYSMEEIAKELNVSESAVKARLYRARHVLRDLYPAARCNGR